MKKRPSYRSSVFSVLLVCHGHRVFVAHDYNHKIMTFADINAGASFIVRGRTGSLDAINWIVFAPRVVMVTHEFLQALMLRRDGVPLSHKISNLSGTMSGFELDSDDGMQLYQKGYAPVLIA